MLRFDRVEVRRHTCFHEAAHAVLHHHAGLTLRWVYVSEESEGMCVSAVPVRPYPWQAMELAAGAFAGEVAVDRARGERRPPLSFDEFLSDEEVMEELAELEGMDCDELLALKMLRVAASSGLFGDLATCYAAARRSAENNVDLLWANITVVAERLEETGYLNGPECADLIESATMIEE